MLKKILIYGAGGAGRELAFALSLDTNPDTAWKVQGFIDDTENLRGKTINDIPVIGGFDYLRSWSGNIAVTIVDYPAVRQNLISKIKENNKIKFPVLISSTSIVSPFVELGEGCIVNHLSVIPPNAKVGNFVFITSRSGIGHDTIIGDFTTIYAGINIGGGASIGSRCVLGSGTTILPKVKIGDGSIVGAGSLVLKDVPSGVVVGGVPAKIIREIE